MMPVNVTPSQSVPRCHGQPPAKGVPRVAPMYMYQGTFFRYLLAEKSKAFSITRQHITRHVLFEERRYVGRRPRQTLVSNKHGTNPSYHE